MPPVIPILRRAAPWLAIAMFAACATPVMRAPEPSAEPATASAVIAPVPEVEFRVQTVSPTPADRNVPRNTLICVHLTSEIDPESVTPEILNVESVPGSITAKGATLIFRPSRLLPSDSRITVRLDGSLRSRTGTTLRRDYRWIVQTGKLTVAPAPMQVPVVGSKSLLFRYPYLQSDTPAQMKILWATSRGGQGQVLLQRMGDNFWQLATSAVRHFPTSLTGMSQGFYQHEVILDDLDPGSEYRYRLLQEGALLAREIPLKTLPAIGDNPVRLVVFADFGDPYSTARRVRDAIARGGHEGTRPFPHDFVVGVGDIAYYSGTYAEFDRNFFDQMSGKIDIGDASRSILSRRPFVPVLGNHEYGRNEAVEPNAFLDSFSNPRLPGVPPDQQERYFSFNTGNAHFVVLDSINFLGNRDAAMHTMLDWLDRDLSATRQKWRIVFLHHTPFSHGPHGTWGDIRSNRNLRRELAPILQKHRVSLVFNGHDHLYERTKRLSVGKDGRIIRNGECQIIEKTEGVIYVTVGNGGTDLDRRNVDPEPCGSAVFSDAVRQYGEGYDFVAMRKGQPVIFDSSGREPKLPAVRFGFTYLDITAERISVRAVNYQGEALDEFEVR